MSWLLLFALTASLLLLPVLPTLAACRRRRHEAPPPDPMAGEADRRVARLRRALAEGRRHLDLREIVRIANPSEWPLSAEERRRQRSLRVWHAKGDLTLPRGMHFAAEVVADGHLHTAPHGRHQALWAGRRLVLAERGQVDGWAHAQEIEAGPGCRLRGPVSAGRCIALGDGVGFTHLQAPQVDVRSPAPPRPARPAPQPSPAGAGAQAPGRRVVHREALALVDGLQWQGDLVGHAAVTIGHGCVAGGSVKSLGELRLGDDVEVSGHLIAEGRIVLGAGCRVGGAVISRLGVVLGAGCTVGTPERLATVSAPRLDLGPGVRVHGTLVAEVAGTVAP